MFKLNPYVPTVSLKRLDFDAAGRHTLKSSEIFFIDDLDPPSSVNYFARFGICLVTHTLGCNDTPCIVPHLPSVYIELLTSFALQWYTNKKFSRASCCVFPSCVLLRFRSDISRPLCIRSFIQRRIGMLNLINRKLESMMTPRSGNGIRIVAVPSTFCCHPMLVTFLVWVFIAGRRPNVWQYASYCYKKIPDFLLAAVPIFTPSNFFPSLFGIVRYISEIMVMFPLGLLSGAGVQHIP